MALASRRSSSSASTFFVHMISLSAFALLCATPLAVRLSSEEVLAQTIDWRKVTAVGTLGAVSLSSRPGLAAARKKRSEESEHERVVPLPDARDFGLDEYDFIETMLATSLLGNGKEFQPSAIAKLSADFARRYPKGTSMFSDVYMSLISRPLHPIHAPANGLTQWEFMSGLPKRRDMGFEFYGIERSDGNRGAVIARLLRRSPLRLGKKAETLMVKQMIQNAQRASEGGGPFLRILAQSHSSRGAARDPGAEVMLMMEPFSATLGQYIEHYPVSLPKRLSLFYSLLVAVDDLHRMRIVHHSFIDMNTVLIVGDLTEESNTTAVFCPSIFATHMKVQKARHRIWKMLTGRPWGFTRSFQGMLMDDLRKLGMILTKLLEPFSGCSSEQLKPLKSIAEALTWGDITSISGRQESLIPIFETVVTGSAQEAAYEDAVAVLEQRQSETSCELGSVRIWDAMHKSMLRNEAAGAAGIEVAPFLKRVHGHVMTALDMADKRASRMLEDAINDLFNAAGLPDVR